MNYDDAWYLIKGQRVLRRYVLYSTTDSARTNTHQTVKPRLGSQVIGQRHVPGCALRVPPLAS